MQRTKIINTPEFIGQKVKLAGWVNIRRDHGKLIFIDLRDGSGMIQTVILPNHEDAYEKAKEIRSEYIIEITGLVKERPGSAKNEKITTGNVEVEVEDIKIISQPEGELPVDISAESLNLHLENQRHLRSSVQHALGRQMYRQSV